MASTDEGGAVTDSSAEWCPLSQQPCRDDCAWCSIEYEIDDEGVSRETFCALAVIAGQHSADSEDPSYDTY